MMYLYEELKDKALQLIDAKSTTDDIKAGKDLALINEMINAIGISSKHINEGIILDAKLNDEYPEIQLLRDAANAMKNIVGANTNQVIYETSQDYIKSDLKTDCFGILVSVLMKHQVISAIKDFIRFVD